MVLSKVGLCSRSQIVIIGYVTKTFLGLGHLVTPLWVTKSGVSLLWSPKVGSQNGPIQYLPASQSKMANDSFMLPYSGLPTFRNCLEGETSSAERKNPWVWSRPAYRAPDVVQGESPIGVQGSAPLCRKICIWRGRMHNNFRPLSSLDL